LDFMSRAITSDSLTTFGKLEDRRAIREVVLRCPSGAKATIMEWGAVVRDLIVMGPNGAQRVVLGFPKLDDYINHSPHFGAIAGRYANRIRGGRFVLDGVAHQLPLNQAGKHSLHGGGQGFGKRPWAILHHDAASVTMALVSPDGDHGYPGELSVTCRYTLLDPGTLRVELTATSDAPTILNLCHHSYFNLDGSDDILDHELSVRANLITPVDADLIPDGSLVPVSGTPFDFRTPRPIRHANPDGTRHWYDHNFVLRREKWEPKAANGLELAQAATLRSVKSGISMEVWTTEPCLQVYDGFKIDTPVPGLDGKRYGACAGICLEPQHAPDSPNLPHLPSTVLRPGELYRQRTEYRFG
jgi:aldose 1-epimerase